MADRFPLILNTNANQIQEIASGDTLDLTNNNISNAGIVTAASFSGPIIAGAGVSNITAGIGTYTDLRVGGNTTFSEDFVVTGNARVTGILTVGTSSIILNDSTDTIKVGTALTLGHTQGVQFHTQNLHSAGFEVNQINASGIITATGADINGDIDVDGHTNLDNVSVGGATTTSGVLVVNASTESTSTTTGALRVSGGVGIVKNLYVGGILDSDGPTHLDYVSVAGVTTHSDTVHIIDDKVLMFGSGGDSTIEYDENGTDQLTIAGAVTRFTNTTQSTSKDTGSVIFEGGLGVEKNLSVGGNVSVGGVLTYEDVTNVDSVGIITARKGVRVTADGSASADYISVGAGNDFKIYHTGNHAHLDSDTGHITATANQININNADNSQNCAQFIDGSFVKLFYAGNLKLSTEASGVNITGVCTATTFSGSGASLTNLNATNLSSGTVPLARLGDSGTKSATTFLSGDNTFKSINVAINSIASDGNNRVLTSDGDATATAESGLRFDGTKLEIEVGYGGGGGTGLVLNDNTSTGANEGMNIMWVSGTDKQSDQCRLGQFSNATGSGSNLDFYTNHQDTGSSTRRLRITHDGKIGINNTNPAADLHLVTNGSSAQDGVFKIGGSNTSLGLVIDYDQAGYTTSNITANPTYSSSGTILKIRTNAGDNPNQLVLKGDSNIGIGTDNPQRLLNIVTRSSTGYSATGYSAGGTTKLRIHNVEGTDNSGVGYSAGLEFVVANGANSYGQLGYVRSGNNVGDFYFKHRTAASSYAETTRIRHNGHLVNRGPMYGIWNETVMTPNGGSRDTQFIQDSFGTWIIVAKIQNIASLRANQASTATLDTTNNDFADGGKWSSNWGDSYPVAVRYISASDWNFWRETRVIDFIHGVPHGRQYKAFFTDGQSSGMNQNTKWGWTCDGAWDGFGRWHNPTFAFWRMSDGNPTTVSQAFFTTAGGSCDFDSADDAKFGAHHSNTFGGQDTNVTTVYGVDDGVVGREDNFPNAPTNNSGTDFADYGLWVCINLGTLGQFH